MKNTPGSSNKNIIPDIKHIVAAGALATTLFFPNLSTAQAQNKDGNTPSTAAVV